MANNVLILGSTGFIGKFLTESLRELYNIHSPDRNELDLTNTQSVVSYFSAKTFDVVINCAAKVESDLSHFDSSVVTANLLIFNNLYQVRNCYKRLINFGSGAEFDRTTNINEANEDQIFTAVPKDHYGLSKNIISRMITSTDNFYTLRLFGVFGSDEPQHRLLKKVKNNETVILQDRLFDYFYINDLLTVLDYFINHTPKYKDINVVYPEKITLSNFIEKFLTAHKVPSKNIILSDTRGLNYTGSAKKIQELNFNFIGIDQGLKDYI